MTHFKHLRSTAFLATTAAMIFGFPQIGHTAIIVYTDNAAWQSAVTSSTLIDFDDLADNTPLATQYSAQGVTFSANNGGNPLVVTYTFPQSQPNWVSLGAIPLTGGGGGVTMEFADAQRGVGFWYQDSQLEGNSVTLFGDANLDLGTYQMAYPSTEWLFIGFIDSDSGIRRVDVTIGAEDQVGLDSLQMSPVPLPQAWALLLGGLGVLSAMRRRRSVGGRQS